MADNITHAEMVECPVCKEMYYCPVCKEVYRDPRALPCLHTYCLMCIDGWCKGKLPGDEANCALCRKAFRIPYSGLHDLPKNFFIEQILSSRAAQIRHQMFIGVEKLSSGKERCREMLEIVAKKKGDYIGKQMKLRMVAGITLEIWRHLLVMECYKCSLEQMLKLETAYKIVESVIDSPVPSRVQELLLKCDSVLQMPDDLSRADIIDDLTEVPGHMSLVSVTTVTKSKEPTLVHVAVTETDMDDIRSVAAVTSLGNDVFVFRDGDDKIQVYDVMTLTLQRCLNIDGLSAFDCSLAACGANNCLYVADTNNETVHRVDMSGNVAATKWQVQCLMGLSVNGSHNVLVTCIRLLQEYTTQGKLVREIILQDVTDLWHAIQLSSGQFVVSVGSHKDAPRGVLLIDNMGRTLMSCSQTHGDSPTPLDDFLEFDVTSSGFIVATGFFSKRIVRINPTLTCARELHLPIDSGLFSTLTVHIDELRDRLYVGENCLMVFENIVGLIENSSC